ncbi:MULTISPECIES: class I SAM-dependent methyltransferase [Pyrobaculum]|uniref:Methyltransferase type 11 n=2 Tax=Pyrobaculum arsenaticum TaxID=121277 RepID=A4WLQ1_PYRAR|nr:methyltransferase domain-containing protein [Pyrobaculum arsenaticum]ABP51318.1 Methyltransferase type 11 [Pyrobaculum arsenaticum DSM 13514]MCY0889453.1 methyltransferase domain-containing protein [Pyrobaculum arsenaticum]NYR16311.1 class I SAM-dependent methyltransferase [Pyrobaculum arsenaticum]
MEIDHVLELYRQLAPVYEEVYGAEQRAKYLRAAALAGEKVVDAGCGTGIVFEVLSSYVVCLDISTEMLGLARDKRGIWGELLIADYRMPPFRDGAFSSALFISSADPRQFDELASLWSGIAGVLLFEFKDHWRVVDQRNYEKSNF